MTTTMMKFLACQIVGLVYWVQTHFRYYLLVILYIYIYVIYSLSTRLSCYYYFIIWYERDNGIYLNSPLFAMKGNQQKIYLETSILGMWAEGADPIAHLHTIGRCHSPHCLFFLSLLLPTPTASLAVPAATCRGLQLGLPASSLPPTVIDAIHCRSLAYYYF